MKGGSCFFFGIQIKKRANFIASQRIIRKRCPLVQNRFNNVTVTYPLRKNAYRPKKRYAFFLGSLTALQIKKILKF